MSNMLSGVQPWDLVAEGYADVTMKLFNGYAQAALDLCGIDSESKILDIACGPGTLTLIASKKAKSVTALDFSQQMIDILNKTIKDNNIENIETYCGDGQNLLIEDNTYTHAFSMFGLMFFPDRNKGFTEMFRVIKPGAKVLVSSWAPTEKSSLMVNLMGALRAINPDMPKSEADLSTLENPEIFKKELEQAGFKNVYVTEHVQIMPFETIDQFWCDMVKGSAPLVVMKKNMPEKMWQEKSKIAIDYLKENITTDLNSVSATAYYGYGEK